MYQSLDVLRKKWFSQSLEKQGDQEQFLCAPIEQRIPQLVHESSALLGSSTPHCKSEIGFILT